MTKHSSPLPQQPNQYNQEFDAEKASRAMAQQPIVRWAVRTTLSELDERKPRRRRAAPVPETPRIKSETELREDAAWKQVEETGKPVILDDCLLVPNGMSMSQAISYMPDGLREATDEAWNAQMSKVWRVIIDSTEKRIREQAGENGKLAKYDSLPPAAKHALTESVVREQWHLPEVPLDELIRKWEKPAEATESKPEPKKKSRRGTHKVDPIPTFTTRPNANASADVPARANTTPIPSVAGGEGRDAPPTAVPKSKPPSPSGSPLAWNREHHRFLLRRLDQIWGYLDAEEQQAVQALLQRKIGKREIDQIDETVKGVEWARRLLVGHGDTD